MLSLSAAEYRRSLRRQGIRQLAAAAAKAAPAAATAAPAAPPSAPSRAQPAARQPASGATAGVNGRRCRACCKKRRKSGLMAGLAHSQQAQRPDGEPAADEATSAIDKMVARRPYLTRTFTEVARGVLYLHLR